MLVEPVCCFLLLLELELNWQLVANRKEETTSVAEERKKDEEMSVNLTNRSFLISVRISHGS